MTALEKYNKSNPIKETFTTQLGNDNYTLEVRELGYNVLVNGKEIKAYKRLPSELREFFNA